MSRLFRALILLLFLASCGSGKFSAPRELNDACAIVSQRPEYLRAFKATERKWGVPVSVQMATMYQESKFIGNARPPHRYALGIIPMGRQSSAYGYSQALDATWEEYQKDAGGRSAKRNRIRDAADFMGWYMAQSQESLGIPLWDAENHYLAYHEGRTGFARQSYNSKPWLIAVADAVGSRSLRYSTQLQNCR